jgi:hypothetical protein
MGRRAAIIAHQALLEGEWQPMEMAPKDGTKILCYMGRHHLVRWDGLGWWNGQVYIEPDKNDYWLSLPEPPKVKP